MLHLYMHFLSKFIDIALTFKYILQCYYTRHILFPHDVGYTWGVTILDKEEDMVSWVAYCKL